MQRLVNVKHFLRMEITMMIEFLNPPTLNTIGWTHVVTATAGKTIYISGQVSVNEKAKSSARAT